MLGNLPANSNSHGEANRYGLRAVQPHTLRIAGALLLLCLAIYVPPAVLTPFFTKGEPREGLVVRRMLEQGDWILPKRGSANGWTIASKPPFFHWLGALAARAAGGTDEFVIRLPSVVLGTVTVLLVWRIGCSLLSPPAALAGAVVLATTFEWVRATSTARVDGVLTSLMTVGLILFYRGFVAGGLSRREALVAYAALACAVLTKGPVGFLLPALVLGVALTLYRRLPELARFRPLLGALVVIAIAGSWYLAAWHLGGDAFFRKHVLKENVFRFVAASELKSGHVHPVYYYLPIFVLGFLPWTPFLLAALVRAARSASARRDPRIGFLLVWFAVVFLFYSAASAKRSVYLLALYPAAALLTGWWWSETAVAGEAPWMRRRAPQAVAVTAAVVIGLLFALVATEALDLSPLGRLAPFLHPKDRANLPLVQAIIDAQLPFVIAGVAGMLATVLVGTVALRRADPRRLLAATTALAVTCWLLIFAVFQPPLARRRTLAPFLATAARETGGAPIYFYPGTFDFGAAFYAPPGTRHWRPHRAHGPGPHYLLVWDDALSGLVAQGRVEVIATSEGTDPKGARRLTLVRAP